jgi:hypothetical protein
MRKEPKAPRLLERREFREAVFERDAHKCVFCDEPAVDAHHIFERRLWPDGGYYLDNGASVCEEHHIACEKTLLSVEDVRLACGIRKVLVPPHLYADQPYDKWGNPVLPNGTRLMGELFHDESVQKILKAGGVLGDFTHYVKYPRTHHVPWSPGMNEDDRRIPGMSAFEGTRVIATEKMDGENTTMYRDYIHARSLDGRHHPSRNWVKNFWSTICGDIPEGWRLCGENLYAVHSIRYEDLSSYFMGFSIWTDRNECLSWDDTLEWFDLLGVTPVEVLFDGEFDETALRSLYRPTDWDRSEGWVLRTAEGFHFSEFRSRVAKFVREGHVQTVKHWMHGQAVEPNGMIESAPGLGRKD